MKRMYLLPLLLLPLACSADMNALIKAQNDFNRSLVAFNEKDSECRDSATVLPSTTFASTTASKEEQKIALRYHYFKSLYDCTDEVMKEHLVASSVLAALADKERAQSIYESSLLIIDVKLHMVKAEADYQRLDERLRASLERIDVLLKPFRLIESAEALGL